MDLALNGKRAIVTGSTSGIGLACARTLAAEGATVLICGRNEQRLADALASFAHGDVTGVAVDVTKQEGRAALLELCPSPDILVNNLSGPPPRRFFDTTPDEWNTVLDSHLLTPLEMIRAVVPGMRSRRFGRIVNITSAMVLTPRPHHVLSTSARTALTAAAKAISIEVASDNVTINNILPERIDTPRQEQMARAAMDRENVTYEEARAAQVQSIAAKRLGRPDEVAEACAFLCSEHAGYISGQNLRLDGGSSPSAF
ncbi:3-oxoacyl-ACP reductase (plasmid) [Rhodococcus erythropolis]|uniref:SDR family oxidoreductase n=1 Tax=Rhodococcus erythropolis TaxID=1833 RepID=UPI00061B7DDF|nr:SDR family oxidoreductase [Rhodococcus erythropolis]AKE01220.1 3-oxoacyl-ACP reductase [Rhodococcus erythropolis]